MHTTTRSLRPGLPHPFLVLLAAMSVGGSHVPLTLFCLLVLTVVLPVAGLLTDLDRASTARTLAAIKRREEAP
jgi:hypothetical protein